MTCVNVRLVMRSFHLFHASWVITVLTWSACSSGTTPEPDAKPWTGTQLGSATGGTKAALPTSTAAAGSGSGTNAAAANASGSGGAVSTARAGAPASVTTGGAALPCNVSQILTANCGSCHG